MKVLYADVAFVINALIDCLILFMTACFLHIDVKLVRLFVTSSLAGAYSIIVLAFSPSFFLRLICQILSLIFIDFLCFGRKKLKTYIKIVFLELAFSLLLGGVLTFAVTNVNFISGGLLMSLCVIAFVACSFFGIRLLKNDVTKRMVEVIIENSGRSCKCFLLCDSGNLLIDPYNLLPVIMLDNSMRGILVGSDDCAGDCDGIRLVPIKTAGGISLVEVITPDAVTVCEKKRTSIKASVGFMSVDCFNMEACCGIIPTALVNNF